MTMLPGSHTNVAQAIARTLIRNNQFPLNQHYQEMMCNEWERQKEQVQQLGYCDAGCNISNIIVNNRGESVCRWTRLPCQSNRLSLLVQIFSIPNGRHSE